MNDTTMATERANADARVAYDANAATYVAACVAANANADAAK